MNKNLALTLFFLFTFWHSAWSQSILDDLSSSRRVSGPSELVDEKIDKVSLSRRIFVITNRNSSFSKGDFISLLLNQQLVARAIVAKLTNDGLSGIKIVKIYDMESWEFLQKGTPIQVLRGDDSYYQRMMNDEQLPEEMGLLRDEESLFDDSTFLEDDLMISDRSNRVLRNDHLASVYLGFYEGVDNAEQATRYQQFNASYAYQIEENIFIEGSYGRNLINDFPTGTIDTLLQNFTIRAKYVVKAPYFSFVLPYVGFQYVTATSDDAGVQDATGSIPAAQLDRELDLLDALQENRPVFGVTIIKRLVPGWFLRGSLGNDQLGMGLALEF